MWIIGWAGCGLFGLGLQESPAPGLVRETAMDDHQVAVHRARDAVIAQDLDGVRRAGEVLAVERVVPLLPPPAVHDLERVREAGAELARVSDLDVAATLLVDLTATCARCHTILEVPPQVPMQATQRDMLWTALSFHSEAHWQEGARRDPRLQNLDYWDDRRFAVALRLQGGQL